MGLPVPSAVNIILMKFDPVVSPPTRTLLFPSVALIMVVMGFVRSTVIVTDDTIVFPPLFVALAVMIWLSSVNVGVVNDHYVVPVANEYVLASTLTSTFCMPDASDELPLINTVPVFMKALLAGEDIVTVRPASFMVNIVVAEERELDDAVSVGVPAVVSL